MKPLSLLTGTACVLILLGLTTRRGEVLALAIPLVLYIAMSLISQVDKPVLEVKRSLSANRVLEGQEVRVSVEVENLGDRLEEVPLEDSIPAGIRLVEGNSKELCSLETGGRATLKYSFKASRGTYRFPAVKVMIGEGFGLIQREITLPAEGEVTALPKRKRLQRMVLRSFQTRAYAGPIPARVGGAGVTFLGLREYKPGDPLRWIHWRSAARNPDQLLINEFEQERITDVGILLDARRRAYEVNGDAGLFEYAVEAAGSLADLFLGDGHRVSLLIFGWEQQWVSPGYGKIQSERIRRRLANAQAGESVRLEAISTRVFPPRTQIVMISPLEEADVGRLIGLRGLGYEITLVSPNLMEYAERSIQEKPGYRLAYRIARVEKEFFFSQLRKAGVGVVDWKVEEGLERAIGRVGGRRGRQALQKLPRAGG